MKEFSTKCSHYKWKSGLTPKTIKARVAHCNHSIASMVFRVNPLFLEGLQITLSDNQL